MKQIICCITLACLTALGCRAAQKVDEFTTKSGKKVTITCIKHASMEINYNGVEIQVDPVGMWLKPETDYATFPKANIILITHEHKDHFDREAIHQIRTPATAIYVNQAVFGHFKNGLVMKNGEKVQYADDISIEAVPLRIYIAGDTEDIPEMADIKDIDIAFLPCNQPYTMTVDQVVNAAKIIKPKILFPYHYNDTPVHKIAMLLAGSGTKVIIRDYK